MAEIAERLSGEVSKDAAHLMYTYPLPLTTVFAQTTHPLLLPPRVRRTALRRGFVYVPFVSMTTLMSVYNGNLVRYQGILCQRSEDDSVEQELISPMQCEEQLADFVWEEMPYFYNRFSNRSDSKRFMSIDAKNEDGESMLKNLVTSHVCNIMS